MLAYPIGNEFHHWFAHGPNRTTRQSGKRGMCAAWVDPSRFYPVSDNVLRSGYACIMSDSKFCNDASDFAYLMGLSAGHSPTCLHCPGQKAGESPLKRKDW